MFNARVALYNIKIFYIFFFFIFFSVYLYIEFIIFYKTKRAKFKLKKYYSFLYWIGMDQR